MMVISKGAAGGGLEIDERARRRTWPGNSKQQIGLVVAVEKDRVTSQN